MASRPDQLVKLNLQTMPLSQCNKTALDYNKDKNLRALRDGISRGQYCAYDPDATIENCGFKGGAALRMFPPNATLPNIIGILSLAAGRTCDDKHPKVFTRIAYYIPWIEANVWPFDRSKPNFYRLP